MKSHCVSFLRISLLILLFLSVNGLFIIPAFSATETISITTYYSAPYGVFNMIRLSPFDPPGFSGLGSVCTNNGEMFYSQALNEAIICNNGSWAEIQGPGLWLSNANGIYVSDNSWNVALGKNAPDTGYKLDVAGKFRADNFIAITRIVDVSQNDCQSKSKCDRDVTFTKDVSNAAILCSASTNDMPGYSDYQILTCSVYQLNVNNDNKTIKVRLATQPQQNVAPYDDVYVVGSGTSKEVTLRLIAIDY